MIEITQSSRRILSALALVVALPPGGALCQDAVTLRMKAQPGAILYWLRNQELQERVWPGKEVRPAAHDTLEVIKQSSTAGEGGVIQVKAEILAKELILNDERVHPAVFGPRTLEYRIDARGDRKDAPPEEQAAAQLWPTLPEEAVKPGHSWKVETKPTSEFPFSIPLTHTFSRIDTVLDRKCAVIESKGELGKQKSPNGIQVSTWMDSLVAIDLEGGWLVKSISRMRVEMEYPEPASDGHQVVRRQVTRVLQQKRPGDVPPATPEDGEAPAGGE